MFISIYIRQKEACVCTALALLGIVLGARTLSAQATAKVSDPNAIALVQKAIGAMGGDGWASVGAGVETETITYPQDDTTATSHLVSSDWSGDNVGRRIDSVNKDAKWFAVDAERLRVIKNPDGKYSSSLRGYDLLDLALSYPSVALRKGLSRSECTFMLPPKNGDGLVRVAQKCTSDRYPGHALTMTWCFDAQGKLSRLDFPALGADGRSVVGRTAIYRVFQTVQGLTVAQQVDIQFQGQTLYTSSFSNVAFSKNLPQSALSIK